mmetsp:Transcript_50128/g.119318  ORF Transcript_50128/g.119318 Transcript_50128/m.119318 type:complete len:458 (+) Transcript_50128:76-1449(+)|eukprot:CAMPEP_0178444560 /NCGR_PEP_ID=MMETSP0689_2-20121128/39590_1 /TAXON_ID=160604 /ORGANISM="Amphidinium massartii, Strain CS-259" /LENGTH=457 /DNA_ID=CAMNT_0020068835 /DNA_START=12 /DNA_END=1385 /DNA_ORIENTATION=+
MGCTQGSAATAARHQRGRESLKAPVESCMSSVSVTEENFFDAYTLGKRLGAGAFAEVRLVMRKGSSGDEAAATKAVKIIDLRCTRPSSRSTSKPSSPSGTAAEAEELTDENVTEDASGLTKLDACKTMDVRQEVSVWISVMESSNPYCVALLEVFWSDTYCYLVMERCESSLLDHLLAAGAGLNEVFLGHIFCQMTKAIEGLHHSNVVHRDVKPDNFLLKDGCVKLGDFGLSSMIKNGVQLHRTVGTAPFMSPEMLTRGEYGKKTDIWSLGVVFYVLLYGDFPYSGVEKNSRAMRMAIRSGHIPPAFQVEEDLRDHITYLPSPPTETTVRNMLVRDPNHRLSASGVLRSPMWELLAVQSHHQEDLPSFRPMFHSAVRVGAFAGQKAGPSSDKKSATKNGSLVMAPSDSLIKPSMTSKGTATWSTRQTAVPAEGVSRSPSTSSPPSSRASTGDLVVQT